MKQFICIRAAMLTEEQCLFTLSFVFYLVSQVVENVLHFFGVFVFGADTFTVNMNMHDLLYDNVIT